MNCNNKPKTVFFPESREIEVNKCIVKKLSSLDRTIYLKLHPSDSYSNYCDYINEKYVLNDFDEALNGTICLARRSTVLLESLYRKGYPCAVLFNDKDKIYVEEIFPSLSNPNISIARDVNELEAFILNV